MPEEYISCSSSHSLQKCREQLQCQKNGKPSSLLLPQCSWSTQGEVILSLVGAAETPGCTGEQIEEAEALAKATKEGKLWNVKTLKPTKLLLEQAHEHYCGSVQMPGHLDEHLDHLDSSQSFDYWSELCLLIFVHCLCLCCGEQGLAGDELKQSRLALAFTLTHPVLWHHTAFLEWEFWEETLCAACQMGLRGL